jgi:beta-alanine degradation protein BauB
MTDQASRQVGSEVLFENDRVRVWRLTLQPGEASPHHRHEHDYLFVHVTPATLELRQAGEAPSTEAFEVGYVEYTEVGSGVEHQIVNRGDAVLHEILVELKGPSRAATPQEPQTNGRSHAANG